MPSGWAWCARKRDSPWRNARLTRAEATTRRSGTATHRTGNDDSPWRNARLTVAERATHRLAGVPHCGQNGVPWDGAPQPLHAGGARGLPHWAQNRPAAAAPQLGAARRAGRTGGRGGAATPAAARTRAAQGRTRAAAGRTRAAGPYPGCGGPYPGCAGPNPVRRPEPGLGRAELGLRAERGRRDTPGTTGCTVVPADVATDPLRTPAALHEVPGHVLRGLDEPLVVGAPAGAAAVPLREQPDLLNPRPDLPTQQPAAQRGDPAAEAGDRVPERRPVAVATPLAAELELVALVRADVGVVAGEGDQCAPWRES